MGKRPTLQGLGGLGSALLLVLFAVAGAAAQDPAAPAGNARPAVTWQLSAGVESFSFRDVAKSRPPVDGSPVRWRGSGPVMTVAYDRVAPLRLHRFDLTASSNGSFVYDSGIDVTERPGGDSATFITGRYDYRRYLKRRLLMTGLQAGIGVRGIGERRDLHHHYAGEVELTETSVTGTIAYVAALRFRRSDRLGLELEVADGATLAHGVQRHTDVVATDVSFGGGWLTQWAAHADVRVTRRSALQVSYRHDGEGLLFDHRSYATGRQRLLLGVTYAR